MTARRVDSEGIPLDPDADAARGAPGRMLADLLAVFIGGAAGTTLRYLVSLAVPTPFGTLAVNLVGAFALGLLLEGLALRGPDAGLRRRLRLTLGTGLLGGFTTYSAFAVETARLADDGAIPAAIAYALGSVAVGVAAAALGILVARRLRAPR